MPRKRTAHENIWRFACYQRTQQALEIAHELVGKRQPLSIIIGAAGAGKTFCAERYASRVASVSLALCPTRHLATPRSILVAIAEAVGVEDRPRHLQPLYDSIRDKLFGLGGGFVILDEADQLRVADLDLLRYLAEDSDSAFCFLGCPALLTVIAQRPALQRRVGYCYNIPVATPAEVLKMLGGRFTEATVAEIYRQTGGNLGHIERQLALLAIPEAAGQTITPEDVKQGAARYLLGAVA